jgi:hypothetical protein
VPSASSSTRDEDFLSFFLEPDRERLFFGEDTKDFVLGSSDPSISAFDARFVNEDVDPALFILAVDDCFANLADSWATAASLIY